MSEKLSREEIHRRVRERAGKAPVPGPSENPATNLLLADVVMRMGSYMLRSGVEKAFLKGRYGKETASEIVDNRSLKWTLGSVVLAKFATRSIPGMALVSTGILGKLLYDHSKTRRANRAKGDAQLLGQAGEEPPVSDT
ncbi:hypothetical protein OZN62_12255 [Aurantiacibacter sp. MUD11]|uniref:hypothetical protein n=1 Tax=Aurantiacibacter sp. MUD11 TaxID=3003265 RepID=UPI0022AA7D46|nr:hypothetical protein [Aurantiacibacter sp. MUD11]WAT17673.1 hypothetical protein OZN62_12255 [Aurantiacibacter sp. MUD11]